MLKQHLYLIRFSCALTLIVIVVGAYTRLTESGLGCPDWPGCYGQLSAPDDVDEITQHYENARTFDHRKASIEMLHRYLAGILGGIILLITLYMLINRIKTDLYPMILASTLIIIQAFLGMLTVTWLLKPIVVVLHLLGGMSILGLLYYISLPKLKKVKIIRTRDNHLRLLGLAIASLTILMIQIFLGGWTSANYAALACPDFPTCQTTFWPKDMDFRQAFTLWHSLGIDYSGGVLDHSAKIAIHITHRIGAVLTALMILLTSIYAIINGDRSLKYTGMITIFFLILQVMLGISNVILGLPLAVAVAHNGFAALLLLSIITLIYQIQSRHWIRL